VIDSYHGPVRDMFVKARGGRTVAPSAVPAAVFTEPEPVAAPAPDLGFDPGDFSVAEVLDYLSGNPDDRHEVLAAEARGKNRKSIVARTD
jgi:hypothetical protein